MSATSASLLRSEWSPSTKWSVTGPGMAAVSRSSSSGLANASRRPETKRQGRSSRPEVLGAQALGTARGMERIADQDQRGHAQAPGGGEGAHAAAEGAAADGDPPGRDREPLRQRGGGGANRLNTDGGRVGAALSGGLSGELDALDGHAGACDRLVNGDEPRLLTPGARSRREDEPGYVVRWPSAHLLRPPPGVPGLQAEASTSARYPSRTASGRMRPRKELRASCKIVSRPRSNASATAARLSATYPPK